MRPRHLALLAALGCTLHQPAWGQTSAPIAKPESTLTLKRARALASPPMVWKGIEQSAQAEAIQEAAPSRLSARQWLQRSSQALLLEATSDMSPSPPAGTNAAQGFQVWLGRVLPREPQVQAAQAALAVAQARYRQARSRLFPTLGLQAQHGDSRDLDGRLSVERHTRQAEASLRWNLYQGGSDQVELAANAAEVQAFAAELRRAKEEAAERLSEAYLDLLRLQRTRDSAAQRLAEVGQLVAQVTRQHEAGKLSELDLQQAQNAELEAELASATLDSDYQSGLLRLRLLAGGELPAEIVDLNLERITPADTARNAALQAAQARASAAQLRVRTWSATLAPKIDFNLRHLLSNRTTPPPSTVQQHGWSVAVSWDWPLGGEYLARRDETLARATQAQADVSRAEQAALAEFASLQPRIANLRRSLHNLAEQENKMAQLLRASGIQFEAGRRSLQQLIQSRDSYFNLQQRRQEQQHRLLQAQLRQLALGGVLLEGLGL